ncbi:MAG: hypothetical protein AAF363_04065 [Bacteroidota bacterium]
MEELTKLMDIVTERSKKVLPIIESNASSFEDNKEFQLYELVRSSENPTDDDLAKKMYNTSAEDPRFKMLKHRLRNRLLNHLFFIDFKDDQSPVAYQHEQEALNQYYYIQTLLKKGDFKLAEKLINKNLSFTKELEFTNLYVMTLEKLMWLFSHQRKVNHYDEVESDYKDAVALRNIEEECEQAFLSSKLRFKKSNNSRKKNQELTLESIKKLEKAFKQTNSYNIFEQYYKLKVLYHRQLGEFKELLAFSEEINDLYDEDKLNKQRFDIKYNQLSQILSLLKTKSFKEGIKYCQFYQNSFDKSTKEYFQYMELYFLLYMYTENSAKAYEIMREVNKNAYFDNLSSNYKLKWGLYKSYLFLAKPDKRLLKSFDADFFFKNDSKFKKKQKGLEIATLILRYVVAVENNQLDEILPIVDRFRKFSTLQLYNPANIRTRLFTKFLTLIYEKEFDYQTCLSRSEVPLSKLKSAPLPGDESIEIEVIPYESLWQRVLDSLKALGEEAPKS